MEDLAMTLVRFNNNKSLFPDFFSSMMENFLNDNELAYNGTRPMSNVKETEDAFWLEFAIPGFGKDDVSIDIDQNVMTVSGKKEEKSEDEKYTRREFWYNEFKRSFTLPKSVDQEATKASFKDGILTVELPKKPEAKPKSLKIAIN